jgi:acetyl esterase/lipase
MKVLSDALGPSDEAQVGDVAARRLSGHRMMDHIAATTAPVDGVETESFTVPGSGGASLQATWYRSSTQEQPRSAVLYLHGGGMIFSLDEMGAMSELAVRRYVASSGVPMLVVDYRVAPEHPHPTPVEDCYAALEWLAGQSETLGFDPTRLGVMGDSAGGGLAAGVCLMARDRSGPAVAQQLLVYPMLDDRTSAPDPAIGSFLTWTYGDNLTGWGALLGQAAGGDDVSPYAAPARHFPRGGHRLRTQAVGCRGAHRVPPVSRLSTCVRGAGLRGGCGDARSRRPHPPTSILVTASR